MTASPHIETQPCWQPLLTGEDAQRALQAAGAIVAAMAPSSPEEDDPSLAAGQAGLAIMDAWAFRAGVDTGAAARAWKRLNEAFDTVAAQPLDASFFGGFTGVAWAGELIDEVLNGAEGSWAETGADANVEIDETLLRLLARPGVSYAPHDLVLGVTGIGVYALHRHRRPSAVACLREVVDHLRRSVRHDEDGSYWWTPHEGILDPTVRDDHPSGYADLGVAHGMAGAIALLGAVSGVGIERATVRPLVTDAARWVTAHAVHTAQGPTYPVWIAPEVRPEPARSAWCYGDPGVAAALLLAADRMAEPALRAEAVALARRAAERPESDTGVVDACFCHGTAGLAHLYNRMFQATGEPQLRETALYWLHRTLDFYRSAQRNGAEWVQGTPSRRTGPWTGLDIVDGAAGVALVLLAAATPIEPTWDRMFLVSAPDAVTGDPT